MKKGKITFAALIIALMLITIDVCFYLLVRPAFLVLTGALAIYGYIRGSMDFRNWLCKGNDAVAPISLPEPVKRVRRNDEPVSTNKSRDPVRYGVDEYLDMLKEPYEEDVDAIIAEVESNG